MLMIIFLGIIVLGALAGNIMSLVEQPDYKLVLSKGEIEIRDYAPMIAAEVEVSGERKLAISEGFKILADYIFGNNISNEKMAMTAPCYSNLWGSGKLDSLCRKNTILKHSQNQILKMSF